MPPDELQRRCVEARRRFYAWPSILRRSVMGANRTNGFMFRNFFLINALHRADVSARDHYPLGDAAWHGIAAEGELTRSVAARRRRGDAVRFELATPADDAEIRRLLRENPMPGRIGISLEREPDASLAAPSRATCTTRSSRATTPADRLIAMGSVSVRERYVNGEPTRVGYLGQLRLDHRQPAARVRRSCGGYRVPPRAARRRSA